MASEREKDPNILSIKRCAIFNSHCEKIVDFYPMASGLSKVETTVKKALCTVQCPHLDRWSTVLIEHNGFRLLTDPTFDALGNIRGRTAP